MTPKFISRTLLLLAAALAPACKDDPTPPSDPLQVTSSGTLERGMVITVSATADGQAVAPDQVQWTVNPADAAERLSGGQLRLLRTGQVQVVATYQGRTGTLNLTVAAPPTILFDLAAGNNRDLYRVALDGGDQARVTTHAADDRDPTVGGQTVVFVSYRSGNADLWSVPLAGGTETRLTTTTASELAPALSRDGQRLAYAYDAGGVAKVWTAQANGSGAAQAAPGFGFGGSPETAPAWAPTGNMLAFVGTADGSADVFRVTPGGGAPTLLAGGSAADVEPAWSPDGAHVAFVSTRQGDPAIFVLRLSDGAVTRVTSRAGTEAEPAWTPDGRLVYVEFGANGETRLVWISLADPATVHPIAVTGGSPRRPAVAP